MSDVQVTIGGNASGAVSAAGQASAALQNATRAVQQLSSAAQTTSGVMTAAAGGYTQAGSASSGYAAQLARLQSQLQTTQGAQQQMSAAMQQTSSQMGAGGIASTAAAFLTDGLSKLGEAALNFVTNTASMLTALIGFNGFEDAAQKVEQLVSAMFDLNVQTERMTFMWQYQFASGGKRDPKIAGDIAAWSANFSYNAPFTRQDIMSGIGALAPMGLNLQGIERFAPLIADLAATHTSIFGGGQLTFSQVALALMEAMTAGNARRMLMELQIQPRELEKYGVKFAGEGHLGGQILNKDQFLFALEAYAKDKGWTGAATAAAHETWWGTYSSFIDRLQNLGLEMGGTDLTTGKVRKGSMFGMLKKDLDELNAWIDMHQDKLVAFADLWGTRIGNAIDFATNALHDFLDGLNSSGLSDVLVQLGVLPADKPATPSGAKKGGKTTPKTPAPGTENAPTTNGKPISKGQVRAEQQFEQDNQPDPTVWERMGKAVGDLATNALDLWNNLQQIGTDFQNSALGQFLTKENQQVLDDFVSAFNDLKNSITPEDKETLKDLLKAIGAFLVVASSEGAMNGVRVLTLMVHALTGLMELNHAKDKGMKAVGEWLSGLGTTIGTWLDGLGTDWHDAGTAWIAELISGLEDAIPGLKGAIDHIKDLFGAPTGDTPDGKGHWGNGGSIHGGAGGGSPQAAHLQRPNGGYAPLYQIGTQHTTIVINGSSTAEINRVIDHAFDRINRHAGAQVHSPGGQRMFGSIGGIF